MSVKATVADNRSSTFVDGPEPLWSSATPHSAACMLPSASCVMMVAAAFHTALCGGQHGLVLLQAAQGLATPTAPTWMHFLRATDCDDAIVTMSAYYTNMHAVPEGERVCIVTLAAYCPAMWTV